MDTGNTLGKSTLSFKKCVPSGKLQIRRIQKWDPATDPEYSKMASSYGPGKFKNDAGYGNGELKIAAPIPIPPHPAAPHPPYIFISGLCHRPLNSVFAGMIGWTGWAGWPGCLGWLGWAGGLAWLAWWGGWGAGWAWIYWLGWARLGCAGLGRAGLAACGGLGYFWDLG